MSERLSDEMVAHIEATCMEWGWPEFVSLAREVQDYRRVTIPCPTCEGSGVVPEYHVPWAAEWLGCPDCEAVGRIPQVAIDMSPIDALCARHGITVEGIVALVEWAFDRTDDFDTDGWSEHCRRLARGEEA